MAHIGSDFGILRFYLKTILLDKSWGLLRCSRKLKVVQSVAGQLVLDYRHIIYRPIERIAAFAEVIV